MSSLIDLDSKAQANFEILKMIYENISLISSDAEGPELIRKHFEQVNKLVYGRAYKKPEAA